MIWLHLNYEENLINNFGWKVQLTQWCPLSKGDQPLIIPHVLINIFKYFWLIVGMVIAVRRKQVSREVEKYFIWCATSNELKVNKTSKNPRQSLLDTSVVKDLLIFPHVQGTAGKEDHVHDSQLAVPMYINAHNKDLFCSSTILVLYSS